MKYAIVGAGAMGCILGSFLTQSADEVILVDGYQKHIDVINSCGLTIERQGNAYVYPIKAYTMSINEEPKETLPKVDIIILTVKGAFIQSTFDTLRALAGENTIILSLQNGVGNIDVLKQAFPESILAYGCLRMGGSILSPGVVKESAAFGLLVGSNNKELKDILESIADDFTNSGLKCEYKEDIERHVWLKMLLNCANNAGCAIAGRSLNVWNSVQEAVELSYEIQKEVVLVAQAKGVDLRESDISPVVTRAIDPEKFDKKNEHFTSTTYDVLYCRKTENEFINGAIVREGKRLSIPTPYNDAMYKMLRLIETTYDYRL